jgi:hypothetical protein
MAEFDRAHLRSLVRQEIGRPAVDEDLQDTEIDDRLSRGQEHWYRTFATVIPNPLYTDWAQMTVAGTFFEVPTSLTNAEVYHEVLAIEVRDGPKGSILDKNQYILEQKPGDPTNVRPRIRLPYNHGFTFTPHCRIVPMPKPVNSGTEPSLLPPSTRVLMVYHACMSWAEKGERHDPAPYFNKMQRAWLGTPGIEGDLGILTQLRMQYWPGDLELAEYAGSDLWYRSIDFGAGGGV